MKPRGSGANRGPQTPERGLCPRYGKPMLRRNEADKAARSVRRNSSDGRRNVVQPFHCPVCDWWHAGGQDAKRRPRRSRR